MYLFLYFFGICLAFFQSLISNYNVLSLFLKLEEERLCLLKYWLKYTPSFPTVESALLFYHIWLRKAQLFLNSGAAIYNEYEKPLYYNAVFNISVARNHRLLRRSYATSYSYAKAHPFGTFVSDF